MSGHFDPAPALALAIAGVNAALGRLRQVVEHRGGTMLPLDDITVVGVCDGFDLIVLPDAAMTVRTRMARTRGSARPAELTADDPARLLDLVEEGLQVAPVNLGDDLGLAIVGVERQGNGAGEAFVDQLKAGVGPVDSDRLHDASPAVEPEFSR